MQTERPLWASRQAETSPPNPEPITTTSYALAISSRFPLIKALNACRLRRAKITGGWRPTAFSIVPMQRAAPPESPGREPAGESETHRTCKRRSRWEAPIPAISHLLRSTDRFLPALLSDKDQEARE